MAVLDEATVDTIRRRWHDGWNRADLDTIMAPFATESLVLVDGVRPPDGLQKHGVDLMRVDTAGEVVE